MKPEIKAALLSGCVFPGFGQIYLKRYRRGLFFIILVLLGVIVVAGIAAGEALKSLKTVQLKGGEVDVNAISNIAMGSLAQTGAYVAVLLLLIACCWIYSVIDAYRIGKKV